MKSKSIGSFFVVLTLVAAIVAITPSAFADHAKVEVSIAAGSSTPGCEETNSCFDPAEAIIDVGGEVTWKNTDTAAHTATSGDLTNDPDNVGTEFDSSLFGPGKTFSHTFEEAGTYPYFCMVHPWMTGVVTVQAKMMEDEETPMEEEEETYANAMSSDGSINVEIESSIPEAGEEMSIHVTFTNADGDAIEHVNYDIAAMQDGLDVLSESGMHEHAGEGMHVTDALASDSPVDVQVTILGIGLPDDEVNWTGPIGDVVSLQVVPEFGTIAALVLAISIVSIIAVTAKSRVIPKL
ncbi:MAG TPA: plastocyanin/azurin family copper-binding protein [Nitrosopumilaceae archaeon]|nr:plastocyanin/azurin family copper-binding protein [Nitrosopumilaceae archaeon]